MNPEQVIRRLTPNAQGCLIWPYGKGSNGYGKIGNKYVHRLVYALHMGPIPKGRFILHKCDNPSCINIDHLYCGTAKDNMADCTARGRHAAQKQTHCLRGHELSGDNLIKRYLPHRMCRKCYLMRLQSRRK